jgi:hypothetical protein
MELKTDGHRERHQALTDSRRRFLEGAGRFALATPPAIALLLSSGVNRPAWASGHANNGFGNGGGDGIPGKWGKTDRGR